MQVGPYELLERIGRGGMGSVWRGRHTALGVTRAIKLLDKTSPEGAARFEREVALLARVRHPHVVAVHEAGVEGGRPWFAMDLVEGRPLSDLMAGGPLPWTRAGELVAGMARGVGALHAAGILHRDLKPQNVLQAADGRPVVLDLGVAVAPDSDDRLTRSGALVGTLAYMAPEQLRGEPATLRSDVYALGVILWELITGEPSISEGYDALSAPAAILLRGALRPGDLQDALPARLDDVCARATDPDPARRFPDAGSLAAALEAVLAAPGPSRREQRRRRGVALLVAVTALAVVASALAPRAPAVAPPAVPPPSSDPAPPPPPSPGELEAGERELARLLRLDDLEERHRRLGLWAGERPGHPARARALEARREARLRLPVWSCDLEGRCRAIWDADGRAWAATDGGVVVALEGLSGRELRRWRSGQAIFHLDMCSRGGVWASSQGRVRWLRLGQEGTPETLALVSDQLALGVLDLGDTLLVARDADVVFVERPQGEVRLLDAGQSQVQALLASPDRRWVAAGRGQDSVTLLNQREPGEPSVTLWRLPGLTDARRVAFPDKVNGLAFAPTGGILAVATSGPRVVLLDCERGEVLRELQGDDLPPSPVFGVMPVRAHPEPVWGVAFSLDGATLWSGSGNGRVGNELRIWDAATGLQRGPARPLMQRPMNVAVSPDGRLLLVSGERGGLWAFPTPVAVDAQGDLLSAGGGDLEQPR